MQLADRLVVAGLIIACASARRESRGLHFTIDHPKKDAAWVRDTVVRLGEGGWPTLVTA